MWSAVTPPPLNQTQRAGSALYKGGQYLSSLSALLLLQHNRPPLKEHCSGPGPLRLLSVAFFNLNLSPLWSFCSFMCTHWPVINKASHSLSLALPGVGTESVCC